MSVKTTTSIVQDFGTKQERCVSLGKYIVDNGATVRSAAKVFGISKSTVHQDITARLEKINPSLQKQVKEVLEKNKQERHIRGGLATKKKYSEIKEREE
ncbi:MAG: sporulation transcriptional regulator SpoIIID [[Eubacterium] siraeum]|nr:sporulation transcriptional regulator SpoIIID [[Eubacterium] siraeum]